jgi:hypothetical protein
MSYVVLCRVVGLQIGLQKHCSLMQVVRLCLIPLDPNKTFHCRKQRLLERPPHLSGLRSGCSKASRVLDLIPKLNKRCVSLACFPER